MDDIHRRTLEALVRENERLYGLAVVAGFGEIGLLQDRVVREARRMLIGAGLELRPPAQVVKLASRRKGESKPATRFERA